MYLLLVKLNRPGAGLSLEVVYYASLYGFPVLITVWSLKWSANIRVPSKGNGIGWQMYLGELGWGAVSFPIAALLLIVFQDSLLKLGVIERYSYPIEYAVFIVVIAPLYEELLFRRYLLGTLLAIEMPTWKAVLLASAVFAAFHLGSYPLPVIEFLGGVLFAGLYLWRKTLIAPLACHIGANLAQALVERFALA